MDSSMAVGIASAAIAFSALGWTIYRGNIIDRSGAISKLAKIQAEVATLKGEIRQHSHEGIADIDKRLTAACVKIELFWDSVQKLVTRQLIQPHMPERDVLLRRFADNQATQEEIQKLEADIRTSIDEFPVERRLAAVLVLVRLQQLVLEDVSVQCSPSILSPP